MNFTRTINLYHMTADIINLSTYEVTKDFEFLSTTPLEGKVTAEMVAQEFLKNTGSNSKVLMARVAFVEKARYSIDIDKFMELAKEVPLTGATGYDFTRTISATRIGYDYIDMRNYNVFTDCETTTSLSIDEKCTALKAVQAQFDSEIIHILKAWVIGTDKKRYGISLEDFLKNGERISLLTGDDEE